MTLGDAPQVVLQLLFSSQRVSWREKGGEAWGKVEARRVYRKWLRWALTWRGRWANFSSPRLSRLCSRQRCPKLGLLI